MRALQWDIFCKVIDNFGDIGVCWRLAADLASRGQRVRLWTGDSSALEWMAPGGQAGVQVLPWASPLELSGLQAAQCDVLVEAFGCEVAPDFIAACAHNTLARGQNDNKNPLWINLEYLSAEPYVAKCHGLRSLVSSGPGQGWAKVFYYPGFTQATGGLLREPDLLRRQAAFDRGAWLSQQGIHQTDETLVSLFCYEPIALGQLLNDLEHNGINGQPVRLLIAAGRATEAVKAAEMLQNTHQIGLQPTQIARKQLSISYLAPLTQFDFDHLLWASDFNFVRGEDSLVRAIWAGKPFVWQIYPQDDGAHAQKLEAFLDMLGAPPGLRVFHSVWNGLSKLALPPLADFYTWQPAVSSASTQLATQRDLSTGLIEYALKNR